jgi:hypothetical protein
MKEKQIENISKRCTGCLRDLPLEEFHQNRRTADGHQFACKSCVKAHYLKNRDRALAYSKKYRMEHLEYFRVKSKEYNARRKRSPAYKFYHYLQGALVRGLPFELTNDHFYALIAEPCFYCALKQKMGGIDRVDNSRGYYADNVVPCCTWCNRAKGKMAQADFIARCIAVAQKYGN